MNPTPNEATHAIVRDGDVCRCCLRSLGKGWKWFPVVRAVKEARPTKGSAAWTNAAWTKQTSWIRMCAACRAAEHAREVGVSGNADTELKMYGRTRGRVGGWTSKPPAATA